MKSRRRKLMSWALQIAVSCILMSDVMGRPQMIKIGGLFETDDDQQELAFIKSINIINADESKLPPGKDLIAEITRIAPQDSFRAYKTACKFLEDSYGIAAFIAPKSPSNLGVLQDISDTFEIPLLQTHWAPQQHGYQHTINLFPDSSELAKAFSQYLDENKWRSFALIFDDNEALIRLQEILQVTGNTKTVDMKVTLRHVMPDDDLSKMMKDMKKVNIKHFVVDLPLARTKQLLEAAEKVNMTTYYQSYLLTSLDMETVEWKESYLCEANITGFSLINRKNKAFKNFLREWKFSEEAEGRDLPSAQPITTESALLYDAIVLLTKAINDLDAVGRSGRIYFEPLNCNDHFKSAKGSAIVNKMRIDNFEGATGSIILDTHGTRRNFTLDVIKVTKNGTRKIESWNPTKGFYKTVGDTVISEVKDMLKNTTLRVTTALATPYIMQDENNTFYGFCIDLLDKLKEKYGFRYTISIPSDKQYGEEINGEWNGMIGQLLRMEADLAITDLTIIFKRESVVDFTMPFMNLGISILFKKPPKTPPPMFSFLEPLSLEVWFYMGTGYLGVSLLLFILARLSPYEWVNPHPCDADNNIVENQFTLLNSFWFTIGSIMQQGSDILPRAISTRIVASSWWFFTLIMISSYTANLAAFLTAQRMTSPIESAEDLAKQTAIQYGCKDGGSTQTFFRESKYPVYQRMWSFMESTRPTVFTSDNKEGIERVKGGNYAFLMESSTIEHVISENCDLMKIGANLDSKGYGIATPPGSPIRGVLSSGILELQETQQLQILKDRWWSKGAKKCSDDSKVDSAEMGIRNVGGVFIVLGIGSLAGVAIVVMEFVWKANKVLNRDSIPQMLWREFKSTLTCRGSTRPAAKDDDEPSVEKLPMVDTSKIEDYKFS